MAPLEATYRHRAGYLRFDSGGVNEKMRRDSAGRLWIGTTTPGVADADQLTIASPSSTGITIRGSSSGNGNVFFSDTTSGTGEYDGFIQYQHSSQNLKFGTGASEKMRIDSSGNVGIGETSADTRLHIKESTTGGTGIFIQNSNGATNSSADLYFGNWNGSSTSTPQARIQAINTNVNNASTDLVFWTYTGSSIGERMRIGSSGNVVFKNSSYVSFNDNGYIRTDSSGYLRLQMGSNGTMFTNFSNSEVARINSSGYFKARDRSGSYIHSNFSHQQFNQSSTYTTLTDRATSTR